MRKTWRKLLSVLLALSMIVSLTVTGYAVGNNSTAAPEKGSKGTELELEEIDPGKLNVPRLGQIDGEKNTDNVPQYKDSDTVRVSIVLEKPSALEKGFNAKKIATSTAAKFYRQTLQLQQDSMAAAIEKKTGHELDVKWNLTLVANAISADVRYGDIASIEALPGVKAVKLEMRYEATPPAPGEPKTSLSTDMVGATGVWANGYTGAGMRIGIIDTGIDATHQSYDAEAFEYALAETAQKANKTVDSYDLMNADDLAAVATQLHANIDPQQAYVSSKIPFGYNYCNKNYTIDHLHDTESDHGSHVAGIAAANRYIKKDGAFVDAVSTVHAIGVAPDAQLLVFKVFGNGGAYSSDIISALEDAITMGCDAVNASIGTSVAGFAIEPYGFQSILESLADSNVVFTVSAGNSGSVADDMYSTGIDYSLDAADINFNTVGSHASNVNPLAVANAMNIGQTGSPLKFVTGNVNAFYSETSGYGNEPIATLTRDEAYEFVLVDGVGVDDNDHVGQEGDQFMALGREVLEGKIAMCYRGTSSFFAKANAAAAQGAAAVVIINNQPDVINMNLTGYEYHVPAVSILQADGNAVKAAAEAHTAAGVTYYTGTVQVVNEVMTVVNNDVSETVLDESSSWGVPGALILKPEITAPGGNIYSVHGAHLGDDGNTVTGGSDQYVSYSGTSMSAPNMAGMSALIAQYIEENGLAEKWTDGNARKLITSLAMSTATPMYPNGVPISILGQGAGLSNVLNAVSANSFITMNEDATAAWADGKVKAELGDDPNRTGKFSYSFNITNMSEEDIEYYLSSDLFTQLVEEGYLWSDTDPLPFSDSYSWDNKPNEHDVNMDGVTDKADAQAILDKITGEYPEDAPYDAEAADMDGDGKSTSYDAHLLLAYVADADQTVLVPAGETVTVTVNLQVEDLDALNEAYVNGFYVEGFTSIECRSTTDDGAMLDVDHSIPILGFCGNWTDASMFDHSDIESLYYTMETGTQYAYFSEMLEEPGLSLIYPGDRKATAFTGNPYLVEDTYPADRLAINSSTVLNCVEIALLRDAATAGYVIQDADGTVVDSKVLMNEVYCASYSNGGGQITPIPYAFEIGGNAGSLGGFEEGDRFTFGLYAVPEYYGMQLSNNTTGSVTADQLAALVADGKLGAGAGITYTMTVDDTAPTVVKAVAENENSLTLTLKDNRYVAYVALLDPSTYDVLADGVPEQDAPGAEFTYTIDLTDVDAPNALVIFVADYAGNEAASVASLSNGEATYEKTIYTLTNTLTPGKEYVIAALDTKGETAALSYTDTTVTADDVFVMPANDKIETVYIESHDVDENSVWTVEQDDAGEYYFRNGDNYLCAERGSKPGALSISTDKSTGAYRWDANNSRIFFVSEGKTRYLYYGWDSTGDTFLMSNVPHSVYLYEKVTMTDTLDANTATAVRIHSGDEDVSEGVLAFTGVPKQLTAEVMPMYLADKSVTWTSSDPEVATVDENGVVTGLIGGEVEITATSNATNTVSDTITVYVIPTVPMPGATINAQVVDARGPYFVTIDLTDGSRESIERAAGEHMGGGRCGDVIIGMNSSAGIYRTEIYDDGYYSEYLGSFDAPQWASRDGSFAPDMTGSMDGVTLTEHYESIYVSSNYLAFFDGQSVFGWNFPDQEGIAYFGTDAETDMHYYWIIDEEGLIGLYATFVDEEEPIAYDEETGEPYLNIVLASCGVYIEGGELLAGVDSMTMLETDDYYGLLIARDGILFFVDLAAMEYETINVQEQEIAYGVAEPMIVAGFSDIYSLTTLYNDDYDAEVTPLTSSSTHEIMNLAKTMIEANGSKAMKAEQIAVLQPAEKQDAFNGGTNAVSGNVTSTSPALIRNAEPAEEPAADDTAADENNVTVEIKEPEEATNGLYEVNYDPEELAYVGDEKGELDTYSIHVDEEQGKITLAFANLDPVAADEPIATLTFEPIDCEDSTITVSTTEFNDNLDLNETETVDCEGTGHDWGEPEWTWNEDNTKATAKFVCGNNPEHVEEIEAKVTTETTDPTCEKDGKIVTTATVTGPDGKTYTDTKEQILPAMDHDWGEPEWTWDDNHKKATATFTCKNCGEKYVVTDDAILTETTKDGKTTYTASVIGPDGKTYTVTVGGVPTGDTAKVTLYVGLMAVSAAAAFVLLRSFKKKENRG